MSHLLAENEYYNEESKTEFQSAKDKPGIHIYNPKTPVELHLPGGIQKFNDVFMESTFRKDMKTVVYEWWWSKTMDFPLFEVTSEQYMENKLQYYIEDYNSKSKDVGNRDFCYVLGQDTRTKFLYDVKDRYLVLDRIESIKSDENEEPSEPTKDGRAGPVEIHLKDPYQAGVGYPDKLKNLLAIRIDGKYSLFELLDRYADASPYDRFYIKGDLDIKVIRIPYDDPLPVPLSLPLTSAGILKGDRYEIKGKNPRNAESFQLVFGDQSLEIPLGAEHEEFALEVTGEEDGRCTAKLNDVELPGVITKGPFLTKRMVLEGDVDFNWVIITKPGGPEAAIGDSKENEPPKEEAKEKTKEKEKSGK